MGMCKLNHKYLALLVTFVLCACECIAADVVVVTALRCDDRVQPVGVDDTTPTLGWQLRSKRRGVSQSAYQVRVASSGDLLAADTADLWDSGRIKSDRSYSIEYRGKPLRSSQPYYWAVRVWDEQGQASPWSKPAKFVTGLLSPKAWRAKWITMEWSNDDPLPIFRKTALLTKTIRRAEIHICGLGQYELRLNGQRVGDRVMDPGWTNYRKTCLYSSYDVTDLLVQGENAIGVMLGNGMYNVVGGRYVKFKGSFGPPKLICQMHVTFADGSRQVIASDATWKCAAGPITFTCIFGGEDCDARREQQGWDAPGFDDSAWAASSVCEGPGGTLVAQTAPPVKVADTLRAVTIKRLDDGRYEADCGINLSAQVVVKVSGKPGDEVTVTCGERSGVPWKDHSYTYTLKGEGEEILRPRFTFSSLQYIYITGVTRAGDEDDGVEKPLLLEASSEFITSSATDAGAFECSNKLLNDINAMIDRSVRSNLHHVLMDCPHREKLGWLEVAHLMGPSILYNRDAHSFYRKICRDTSESQLDDGLVPDIAPEYVRFKEGFFESAEWGSASVQLPWLLYRWYDDRDVLQKQYETMKRYVRYLAESRNGQGLAKPGLGDWYEWVGGEKGHGWATLTPPELPATAFFYDNARIVTRVAKLLGQDADVAEFQKLAQQVRKDFLRAYYKPSSRSVANGSQAALATALYFELVPEEDRGHILANLLDELKKTGYQQTAGEICFRMLLQTLADAGRSDVVFRIISRTDSPGYGHLLKLGFKTLSERLDRPGTSMNHCMWGHPQEWFQKSILGIGQAPDSLGFKHLVLRPEPVGDLTSASGYYDSMHGRIESRWKIENGRFHWEVTVPPNATAEVHVPAIESDAVTEGDQLAAQVEGIKFIRNERPSDPTLASQRAVFEIGSGSYRFRSPIAQKAYQLPQEK